MRDARLYFLIGALFVVNGPMRGEESPAPEQKLNAALKMSFKLMGGEIEITGESADVLAKTGVMQVTCRDLDLGELVAFIDPAHAWVQKAEGRVQGQVRLRMERGELTGLGPGRVELVPGTAARLTLSPVPGLFSMYMPERVRKVYPGLDALEAGRTPLVASVLRLEIPQEVDPQGRLGWLKIEGRPDDDKLVAPLSMEMNFRGEVMEAVRQFLKLKLRLGGG